LPDVNCAPRSLAGVFHDPFLADKDTHRDVAALCEVAMPQKLRRWLLVFVHGLLFGLREESFSSELNNEHQMLDAVPGASVPSQGLFLPNFFLAYAYMDEFQRPNPASAVFLELRSYC
jgi:hypothetical protein